MANSLFHLISEPLIGSSFCTQTLFPCCFRPFPDWWKFELICSWDLCLLFRSRKCILFRGDSLTRMPVTTTTTCRALTSEPTSYVQVVETPQKLKVLLRGGQVVGWDSQCRCLWFYVVKCVIPVVSCEFPWFLFFSNFLENPLTFTLHSCVFWSCQCSDL